MKIINYGIGLSMRTTAPEHRALSAGVLEMGRYDLRFDRFKTSSFDPRTLWDRVGGDAELLRQLVGIFLEQYPRLLQGLTAAINQRSFDEVMKLSHKLKGSTLQFSGVGAANLAASLEQMGQAKSLKGAGQLLSELEQEIAVLVQSLQSIVSELGLASKKIVDLSDSSRRGKLTRAAIEAVLKIVERWNLKNEDAMRLLGGISNGRFYELKKTRKTHKDVLTQDELTRVSLLIGIFKALNILFFNEKLANQWVSRPNSNAMFNNAPPLKFLIEAGIPGMLAVRRLLDSRVMGR